MTAKAAPLMKCRLAVLPCYKKAALPILALAPLSSTGRLPLTPFSPKYIFRPISSSTAMSSTRKHGDDPFQDPDPKPKRIVLCFDGTGNSFLGNPGDTNIVKLLNMFDRKDANQMHYYQPGIGTYTVDGSVNQNYFGQIKSDISKTIDSAIATSFDAHVIAGYRFLMRYYSTGDHIYLFGFSRGVFTARFLARMIASLGILSMGNEEMAPFAYKVYQDYELANGDKAAEKAYLSNFTDAFCRYDGNKDEQDCPVHPRVHPDCEEDANCPCFEFRKIRDGKVEPDCQNRCNDDRKVKPIVLKGVKAHFLGLFDTVNSVGTFDVPFTKTPPIPEVGSTAKYVRHAVAIDERRVKFKAALLAQEKRDANAGEDNLEVWFPGNHGDIGGGWEPQPEEEKSWSNWFKTIWLSFKPSTEPSKNTEGDRFQLSDIALNWMINELDKVSPKDTENSLAWHKVTRSDFRRRYRVHYEQAITGFMHDTMVFGRGSGFFKVLTWKLMEWLPIIRRWEYEEVKQGKEIKHEWQYKWLPLNKGGTRDIPPGALIHHSVIDRLNKPNRPEKDKKIPWPTYKPRNNVGPVKTGFPLWDAKSKTIKDAHSSPEDRDNVYSLDENKIFHLKKV